MASETKPMICYKQYHFYLGKKPTHILQAKECFFYGLNRLHEPFRICGKELLAKNVFFDFVGFSLKASKRAPSEQEKVPY